MANLPVVDPALRSKHTSTYPAPSTRHLLDAHLKKTSRSTEEDMSYLCSAYLAERGCLSPEESQKRNSA